MQPDQTERPDLERTNPAPDVIAEWSQRNPWGVDQWGNVLLGPSENESGDTRSIPYCTVLPPEAFQDTPCEVARGVPQSTKRQAAETIAAVIASGTCGRIDHPTDADFYAGLRADKPTPKQNAAIDAWLSQGTMTEILAALLCGCYTPRELALAIHRRGGLGMRFDTARTLNTLCRREWWPALRHHDPWYDGR